MANYTYTQNGITFDDVKAPLIAQGGITVGNKYSTNAFTGELNSISVDATNAVSIDWNNAQLGNKVDSATLTPGEEIIIQTTGQLLSYMSTIAQTTEN